MMIKYRSISRSNQVGPRKFKGMLNCISYLTFVCILGTFGKAGKEAGCRRWSPPSTGRRWSPACGRRTIWRGSARRPRRSWITWKIPGARMTDGHVSRVQGDPSCWKLHSFCWHQVESCVLVQGVYSVTKLLVWCQQKLIINLTDHPVWSLTKTT